MSNSNVQFLTVAEFKSKVGFPGGNLDIVKNPKTGKLFMSIGNVSYKVQQDFKPTLAHCILIPEAGINEACLINAEPPANNVLFTL